MSVEIAIRQFEALPVQIDIAGYAEANDVRKNIVLPTMGMVSAIMLKERPENYEDLLNRIRATIRALKLISERFWGDETVLVLRELTIALRFAT